MQINNIKANALLLLSTLLLSACGFHLRGSISLPEGVEPIYVSGNNAIATEIRNQLSSNDIQITNDITQAQYQLIISDHSAQKRTVSLGEGGRVAEYQITINTSFTIKDRQGKTLVEPRQLSTRKIIRNDPNNVISTAEEEALLRSEMQQNLASKIIRQLRAANFRATNNQ